MIHDLSKCTIDKLALAIGNQLAISNQGIIDAINDSTTAITADLQAICDKLDAGITVTALQGGAWSFTIDNQPIDVALDAASIADLVTALEAADLTVTVGGQDTVLDVNITNTPLAVTVDLTPVVNAVVAEGDQTQALLQQLLDKPRIVLIEGCLPCPADPAEKTSGFKFVSVSDTGVATDLSAYYLDGTAATLADFGECCACGGTANVIGCIQFEGFDVDRGLFTVGDTTPYDVTIGGVTTQLIMAYDTTADGVNISTWYDQLVNWVNTNTSFTMSVATDVAAADQGKVLWQLDYSGTGTETLEIVKGGDVYTFTVDATGAITGTILDDQLNPFNTPAIVQACP